MANNKSHDHYENDILNLDKHIEDEVLQEVFSNENSTYQNMTQMDYETSEDTYEAPVISIKNSQNEIKIVHTNEELIALIKSGVDVEKNRNQLVLQNQGIVHKEAKSCTSRIPYDDKVQYGFEALLMCINTYNPDIGIKFITYAGTSIRRHMYSWGNTESRAVEIPKYLSNDNIKIQKFIAEYQTANGKEPSEEEVQAGTELNIKRVKSAMRYNNNAFSLDTPFGSGDSTLTLEEVISGEGSDYVLDERINSTKIEEVMDIVNPLLKPLESELIALVHGLNGNKQHSFNDILDLGIIDHNGNFINSKPTLSRRYNEALDKVKRIIKDKKIFLSDL